MPAGDLLVGDEIRSPLMKPFGQRVCRSAVLAAVGDDAQPGPTSPYMIVLQTARDASAVGAFAPTLDAETVAFTLWLLVHGMAMLESTHLKNFGADFEDAGRSALDLVIASWVPSRDQKGGSR